MKRIYITTIPMQGKFDLGEYEYEPQKFELKENIKTSFPIVPIIKNTSTEDVTNKIIAIRFKNEDTQRNYDKFVNQLKEIGIKEEEICPIEVEENQNYSTGVSIFMQILKYIDDDSEIYACITYGTKIVPIIMAYLLSSIKELRQNADVMGIYYGEVKREDKVVKESNLYDVTQLLNLNNTIASLARIEVNDIENFIKDILEYEE